jgi:hypothetical protein
MSRSRGTVRYSMSKRRFEACCFRCGALVWSRRRVGVFFRLSVHWRRVHQLAAILKLVAPLLDHYLPVPRDLTGFERPN